MRLPTLAWSAARAKAAKRRRAWPTEVNQSSKCKVLRAGSSAACFAAAASRRTTSPSSLCGAAALAAAPSPGWEGAAGAKRPLSVRLSSAGVAARRAASLMGAGYVRCADRRSSMDWSRGAPSAMMSAVKSGAHS
jgi:hypothetical protein